MRRFLFPEVALGFLFATALWVVIAVIYPHNNGGEQQASQNTAPVSLQEIEIETNKRIADYGRTLDWLTAFLVIANIALWLTTWRGSARQSRDMQAALDHARQSLTVIERAFVSINDISVVTISVPPGGIAVYRISLIVRNSGRTPAKAFTCNANFGAFDALPENFRFPDRPHGIETKNVLTAQMSTIIPIEFFIQDAVATYERRKKSLIWGWIEYDDIFPNSRRHRAEFSIAIETRGDPRQAPRVIEGKFVTLLDFRPWGQYNGQDDDCLYDPGQTPVAKQGELPEPTPPPPGVIIVS